MALHNAKVILKKASGTAAIKLLLLTARFSRPGLDPFWTLLLRPFVRNNEITLRYKQAGRTCNAALRMADQESDLHSMLEVVVRDCYRLDPAYDADLVIDGGANIGLFSIQAAAVYPSAKIVVCEPLPRNIEQTKKHLKLNDIDAEILPVCIGGSRRTIPFFCRGANASSFDSQKPYESVLEIDVLRLSDVLGDRPAKRILIKLDIEGMEMESLQSYIPNEDRAVVIFGELHDHRTHSAVLERLLMDHGWSFQLGDLSGGDAIFEAWSPAAAALVLPGKTSVKGRQTSSEHRGMAASH